MSPKIPDVIGGEPIEADWGNSSIRDRTVQRMDDVADRDASIPAPEVGETVFIEDIQELQTWRGTDWMSYISSFGGRIDTDTTAGHTGLYIDYYPLFDDHAVPKSYVDSLVDDADYLPLTGGSLSGPLTAPSDGSGTTGTGSVRDIHYGIEIPDDSLGNDGDLYIRINVAPLVTWLKRDGIWYG